MKYLGTVNKHIYTGKYNIKEVIKNIIVNVEGNDVSLNLNDIIENSQIVTKMLSLGEIEYISKYSNIKACIYPNGNWSWRKLDSSSDRLKSCYLLLYKSDSNTYIFTVAFDEIQPSLYEAELIAILKR